MATTSELTMLLDECGSDQEYDVLYSLAVKAGLLWICDDECGSYNGADETHCNMCFRIRDATRTPGQGVN